MSYPSLSAALMANVGLTSGSTTTLAIGSETSDSYDAESICLEFEDRESSMHANSPIRRPLKKYKAAIIDETISSTIMATKEEKKLTSSSSKKLDTSKPSLIDLHDDNDADAITRPGPIKIANSLKPAQYVVNLKNCSIKSNLHYSPSATPPTAATTPTMTKLVTGCNSSKASDRNDGQSKELKITNADNRKTVVIGSANRLNGCLTKPLVIQPFQTDCDKIANQSEKLIIPTLSSQVIFSSIITATTHQPQQQANNQQQMANSLQSAQSPPSSCSPPSSSLSSPAAAAGTKRNVSTSGSIDKPPPNHCNSISSNSSPLIGPSNLGLCLFETKPSAKQTTASSYQLSSSGSQASGQPVTAKLMDMGKKLLDAAREGQTDHVRHLVVNSGAPFTSDWLGTTALHFAAQNGHTEVADILLRGGVNRDARTKLERTALHLAAQSGSLGVVDLLLANGCDVNARDMLKMTPLHWAVERNHAHVVDRLLIGGADVSAKSKFQLTPNDIARKSNHYEIIELLKSYTINKDDRILGIAYNCLSNNIIGDVNDNNFCNESHGIANMLDVDYHLKLDDDADTNRASMSLDIDDSCIDLVELEWKFEPDFFLRNEEEEEEEEEEPKVEYLMKIVEELQKENRKLRQRIEQLSTEAKSH